MKTLKDYIDIEFLTWLRDNGLSYKLVDIKADKGQLSIVYNDQMCLKIYDGMGHVNSFTVNVTDKYDESIYENDKFTWSWAFEYFKLKTSKTITSSQEDDYKNPLADIKTIAPQLSAMTSSESNAIEQWINKKAKNDLAKFDQATG